MRFLLLFLLASGAAAADPALLYATGEGSTVTYRAVHKFHEFSGTSHKVEGRVKFLPDGGAQAMVRIPASTFDSGNANRDEHMQETVDAPRFPSVVLKAVAANLRLPGRFPATLEVPLKGTVSFHGVDQPLQTTARLTFVDAGHARASASFPISLEAFHVERPSLLFVKVDDKVIIDANLSLEVMKR